MDIVSKRGRVQARGKISDTPTSESEEIIRATIVMGDPDLEQPL